MKTTKMPKNILLGVGGMLLGFSLTLRADTLVPNGNFEDAPASPYVLSGGVVATTSSANQILTGFTIAVGQGALDLANVKTSDPFGFKLAPAADTGLGTTANQQVVDIQEGGLNQLVSVTTASGLSTLTAGTTYTASIEAANANQYDAALGTVTLSFVDLTTHTVLDSAVVTKASLGVSGFTVIPLSFTSLVTSSDELGLRFSTTGTANGSSGTAAWNPYTVVGFDNLTFGSSSPLSVPEPSTYVLMGAGLMSLLAVHRFRRMS
jgi:hypothetical protein